MPKLLVVDDEPNVLYSIEKGLQSDELEVLVAPTGRQGIELVEQTRPDAVILDVRLSDMSGLDVFDQIRKTAPRLPVIIITAYASTETAIEAMKRGAFEYLLKPVDLHQLREVVGRALELSRFRQVPAVFQDEDASEDAERIIGHSPAMQEVYKSIGRFAPRDETVLISGESGTGKELVARALFHHSSRANAGNVRQLQNVLKYALIQAAGNVVTLDSLPENLRPNASPPITASAEGRPLEISAFTMNLLHAGEPDIYRRVTAEVDRTLLETVLRHVKGNQVQASELLGISRTTLRAKLRLLGITFEKQLLSSESNELG